MTAWSFKLKHFTCVLQCCFLWQRLQVARQTALLNGTIWRRSTQESRSARGCGHMCGCKRLTGVTLEALQVCVDQRVGWGWGRTGTGCAADQQLFAVGAQQGAGGVAVRHGWQGQQGVGRGQGSLGQRRHGDGGLQRAFPSEQSASGWAAAAAPLAPWPVEETLPARLDAFLWLSGTQEVTAKAHGGQQSPAAQQDQVRPPPAARALPARRRLRSLRGGGEVLVTVVVSEDGSSGCGGGVALLVERDAEVGLTRSSSRVSGEAAIFIFYQNTATVRSTSRKIKLAEVKILAKQCK